MRLFTITTCYRKEVEKQLKTAQQLGDLRQTKYLLAILAVMDGQSFEQKMIGLIDYFAGRLFYRGLEGRLNSDCYAAFLRRVLGQTEERIVLAQDGARYHTSAAMRGFFEQHVDRLTVFTAAELLAGLQPD